MIPKVRQQKPTLPEMCEDHKIMMLYSMIWCLARDKKGWMIYALYSFNLLQTDNKSHREMYTRKSLSLIHGVKGSITD